MDIKEAYETGDRNYLLVLAAVIDKTVTLKSDAIRTAEGHG